MWYLHSTCQNVSLIRNESAHLHGLQERAIVCTNESYNRVQFPFTPQSRKRLSHGYRNLFGLYDKVQNKGTFACSVLLPTLQVNTWVNE